MSFKIKIQGGTEKSNEDLCKTCRYCNVRNDARYCGELYFAGGPMPIRKKIYQCSDYDDKRLPTKHDLYDQAWILRTEKGNVGSKVGFVSPQEFKKLVKDGKEDYHKEDE